MGKGEWPNVGKFKHQWYLVYMVLLLTFMLKSHLGVNAVEKYLKCSKYLTLGHLGT